MDFDFLADLHKSQCFTTCEVSNPAKSSDFGADGFTASLTDWHELLQVTAPDDTCGIVFVRGQFPNSPGAILARAQRRDDIGGKGTFGTRLQPADLDTDLELGERLAQGWINFRWPFTQYELRRKGDPEASGIYEEISFVRSGTVFQIIRIKWGRDGSSLSDLDSSDVREKHTLKIKTGGVIRFGCPCSNSGPPDIDTFVLTSAGDGTRLNCASEKYQKRLELQLSVNGIRQKIAHSLQGIEIDEIHGTEVDISSIHRIEVSGSNPTFLVSTYGLRHSNSDAKTAEKEDFLELDDYLGIRNKSVHMTDRLWTALCSSNYEASEAAEFCVVGRCIEQIVCVSAVPIPSPAGIASPYKNPLDEFSLNPKGSQRGDISLEQDEITETALLCNIMTPQYVDVQCAFFQIRALVKCYNFISTRHFEPDLLESSRSLDAIREAYLTKLRRFIRSSLIWLINTEMKPGRLLLALKSDAPLELISAAGKLRKCEKNRASLSKSIDQTYNQACYAMLAVWYAMKNCPVVVTDSFKFEILLPQLNKAYEAVQKRASRDKEPTPKNDVLQWLHLSCLFLICNETFGKNNNGKEFDGFAASGLDRQEVLRTQQKFEKYVSRLKTIQIESYSMEHEELERVLLLSEELGLDTIQTPFTSSLALSRAAHTRRRLLDRRRTTIFKPGPKPWKGSRITSNGPWELLCTNHQSFLRVADDSDVRAARDRLFEFLTADYSFMTSWDRADSRMIGKWWDFEAASVICATLLDLKVEGKLRSAMSITTAEGRRMSQSFGTLTSPLGPEEHQSPIEEIHTDEPIRDIGAILLEIKKAQEESNRNLLRQLQVHDEIGANVAIKAFEWMAYKPDQLFHPDWWVQSLHDTPEIYQVTQTKDLPLRRDIRRYLRGRDSLEVIQYPDYSPANINKKIPAEDLQFLSVFDFRLTSMFTFDLDTTSIKPPISATPPSDTTRGSRPSGKDQGKPQKSKAKQSTNIYSTSELETHRNNLFHRLNDSLVDLGTKHRVLFAEKCSPSLVGSFIYMWHPDALDTIDSYFGATSRFAENREALMWTTSITISHWSIRPTSLSKEHHERFNENRNNGEFPPQSIANLGSTKKQRRILETLKGADIVEERSSSLVITGDPQGYLWICSIWSSLTDSQSLSSPVGFLPKLMQRFIHQQTCSRCLVFLVLLGHLCEKLAGEYETILSQLDVIVGLGDKVLLEGLEWGTDEAVDRLKKLLWGLEALRVFNDRLSASLAQVQKAQEAMERTIKQEAGQQHVDLLQEYNNVIEEFEKRYGMLSDVHITTQLKISQITGLRDGISTVTNVEDSQTALRDSKTTIRQGNNIRMLTYITIAYLPLGFVTGLFSIAHASFMDSAGNGGFAILVVVFVLGTYALALSLESIIDQWKRLKKEKWRASHVTRHPPNHHDDDSRLSFNALGSCWGLRRRRDSEEGDDKISRAA